MLSFPKIEKITRDASISHFFVMFGYKLFSIYYPLFLVAKGFSLPQVGWNYLLIYLPIAFFAPIAGFLNHKINPAILASLGIFGYGIYALGMIFIQNPFLFYFWQVLLGISAAMFFTSSRAILMGFPLKNPSRAFGWFYSSPFYADALAPAIGAFFIWRFDFIGVFILSLVLQFLTAVFCFFKLREKTVKLIDEGFGFKRLWQNYKKAFRKIKEKNIFALLLVSFSCLLLGGFYRSFFILFLKDLGWVQNQILLWGSVFSLVFLPISIFAIKQVSKQNSGKNIFYGSFSAGFFSILLGLLPFLNFFSILLIMIGRAFGGLIAGSGRSGLLSKRLKEYPEEAGAIDTIFSPLGIALGSLISGFLIGPLGYSLLFMLGGVIVLLASVLGRQWQKAS